MRSLSFRLLENQFSPEFGGASGGIFNIVVKTGTNDLHGSVYEYFNNRNLNALDSKQALQGFTSTPRFDYNRFGGTVGGPIIKNKLFYFADYEYSPLGQASVPGSPILAPTAAGYSTIAGCRESARQILRCCNSSWPLLQQLLKRSRSVAFLFRWAWSQFLGPSYVNKQNLVAAGDWDIRTRGQTRASATSTTDTPASIRMPSCPCFTQQFRTTGICFPFRSFTRSRQTALNEFRVSYSRKNNNYPVGDFKFPGLDQFPNLTFDDLNLQVGPDSSTPQGYIQGNSQATDNFTKTLTRHTIKAGLSIHGHHREQRVCPTLPRGLRLLHSGSLSCAI